MPSLLPRATRDHRPHLAQQGVQMSPVGLLATRHSKRSHSRYLCIERTFGSTFSCHSCAGGAGGVCWPSGLSSQAAACVAKAMAVSGTLGSAHEW